MGTLLSRRRYMGGGVPHVVETRIVATYNVTSTSQSTRLLHNNAVLYFSAMEVDGVSVSVAVSRKFTSRGLHTVKFTLVDNTTVGANTFNGATALVSVVLPPTIESIGGSAFQGTSISSIVIPKSVTSITTQAFRNCGSLTSMVVESGNTVYESMDCNAIFSGNTLMFGCKGSTVPSGITSIYQYAFIQTSLSSIVIPSTVTSFGNYSFNQATVVSMTVESTSPPSVGSSAFNNSNITAIYVPEGSVDTYKSASGWSSLASKIQAIPT